jgi:hypothetical protein
MLGIGSLEFHLADSPTVGRCLPFPPVAYNILPGSSGILGNSGRFVTDYFTKFNESLAEMLHFFPYFPEFPE